MGVELFSIMFTYNCRKTSPPSAREAAMSAMQHETFLKHSGNTLENHATPLKIMKHPENFLETVLTCPQIALETSLKNIKLP